MRTPTPIGVTPDVDAVQKMRLEMGTTLAEIVAERIEDARTELFEAFKIADDESTRDLHVEVGEILNKIDTLRCRLTEREQA